MTDLLIVSLGTTHGLRVADSMLLEMTREAGASVEAIAVRIGITDRLRRGYPVNDFVEAIAARRALTAALEGRAHPRAPTGAHDGARPRAPTEAHDSARPRAPTGAHDSARPRALLFSTTTAALLAPTRQIPYAVRLDSPAALNRPGALNAPVRALERRSLATARLLIPMGAAGAAALPAASARAEIVAVPIIPSGDVNGPRDSELAVGYTPDPKAKGLARLCLAWARVANGTRRLEIFGIEREAALAFLSRRRIAEPPGVTFRGFVASDEFRATLRTARSFVSAARWEDYGQAPLEALRDGALLVSTPADGPYEALAIARELDPALVAGDLEPISLAAAIETAYQRTAAEGDAYRQAAALRLEPYGWEAAVSALRTRVLPILLDRAQG